MASTRGVGQNNLLELVLIMGSESTFAVKIKGNATYVERSQSCHKIKRHFDDVQKAPSLLSKAPKNSRNWMTIRARRDLLKVTSEEHFEHAFEGVSNRRKSLVLNEDLEGQIKGLYEKSEIFWRDAKYG
ncbi:uncharacterized protein LOC114286699 [Camellia sinensis]|uniref:uncharacterized protein LOC114286699 n=1 Tax=Camellia sinensis TaxID=4442 RepID=UPI001035BC40|nr:uncharacterized protein LOC114286699 [Camellia sinensis]